MSVCMSVSKHVCIPCEWLAAQGGRKKTPTALELGSRTGVSCRVGTELGATSALNCWTVSPALYFINIVKDI